MDSDLRIPVTKEQKQVLQEAARQDPEGLASWARNILLQAARRQAAKDLSKARGRDGVKASISADQ